MVIFNFWDTTFTASIVGTDAAVLLAEARELLSLELQDIDKIDMPINIGNTNKVDLLIKSLRLIPPAGIRLCVNTPRVVRIKRRRLRASTILHN